MRLTEEEIIKIAKLAALEISDNQIQTMHNKFENILNLFSVLDNCDVTNVEPLSSPLDAIQPLRDDQAQEVTNQADLQALSPLESGGLYLVPKVIE